MKEFVPERDLPILRKQIKLGSLFVADYRNDMGFTEQSVCTFFDGFCEYLWEVAEDCGIGTDWDSVMTLDTDEYLIEWFYCFEEFPFEEEEDEG